MFKHNFQNDIYSSLLSHSEHSISQNKKKVNRFSIKIMNYTSHQVRNQYRKKEAIGGNSELSTI